METRERQAAPASDQAGARCSQVVASTSRAGRSGPQLLVIGGTALDNRCRIEVEALQSKGLRGARVLPDHRFDHIELIDHHHQGRECAAAGAEEKA